MSEKKLFLVFFLLAFVLFCSRTGAQTSSSSPYSRYGIGDLQSGGLVKTEGMGGTAYGFSPYMNINISNPASYSSILLTTFETAVRMDQLRLKTTSKTADINSTAFSYFAFGFPVKSKKWGSTFGLLPYSNVGYSVSNSITNSNGDKETHFYEGSGGLNQFLIGNAWSPVKNFSLGFNASYLFGVVNQQRRIEFPELSNYFNTRIRQETSVGAVHFSFGLQLTFDSLRTALSDSMKLYAKEMNHLRDSLETIDDTLKKLSPGERIQWDEAEKSVTAAYGAADSLMDRVVTRKIKSDWSLTLGLTGSPKTSLSATNTKLTDSFK